MTTLVSPLKLCGPSSGPSSLSANARSVLKASFGRCGTSSRNSWFRHPRSILREPFQHRRDHIDVDGVLGTRIVIATGRLFVIDVVGRELRRSLDLEFS